jgi:hypothetical protein
MGCRFFSVARGGIMVFIRPRLRPERAVDPLHRARIDSESAAIFRTPSMRPGLGASRAKVTESGQVSVRSRNRSG